MSAKVFPENVRYSMAEGSNNALRAGDLPSDLIAMPQSFVHSKSKAIPRK